MVLRIFVIGVVVLLTASCTSSPEQSEVKDGPVDIDGKRLFNIHCAACHKYNGTGGVSGAKDLTMTQLKREEMVHIVHQGSGDMMPFKDLLNDAEIDAVVDHIQTLKTN